jgi:hypothetical protein
MNLSNIEIGQNFILPFVFYHSPLDFGFSTSLKHFSSDDCGSVSDHFQIHPDQVSYLFLLILFHGFLLHFSLCFECSRLLRKP